jgi:hypothetical protein
LGTNKLKAKEFRKKYQESRANKDELLDLDFVGCTYKNSNGNIIKKGFFELYHGDKDNEIDFLRSQVQIAEDGQAIYEFLQNAVDAQASEFCIFWDKNNFLVINNGKKFDYNGIKSILNFSQSTKSNNENSIGKFGIGFKLIHRLVGDRIKGEDEENGLNAIIHKYKGPILFSWEDFYFKKLLEQNLSDIDKHWLFKIIYTNFPAGLEENIYDKNYQKKIMFKKNEFLDMVKFIKNQNINLNNYKKGSLFYLKLGEKKSVLLEEELENAKNGIKYSANILKSFNKENKLENILLQNHQIQISDFYPLKYKKSILLFPKSLEQTNIYYNSMIYNISFYKFFPMGDQKNSFNFIVHNNSFDIESNRRKLQETQENKYILQDIAKNIFDSIHDDMCEIILANLYLSDLKTSNNDNFIQENFSKYILDYLKSKIPYKEVNVYGATYLKVTSDKSKVIVVDSKLENIPLKNKWHFYFSPKKHKEIVSKAVDKLNIQRWNIVRVMIEDNINEWILNLDNKKFNILLGEIIAKKKYYSQKIVEIWDNNYTLKQIKKFLKIFSVLDKETITFAVIKNEKDDYEILNYTKNKYIKNPDFKEFLENTYETNKMEWYLIPNELEDDIINIIGKTSSDKELLKELLNKTQHKKVIDFIEYYYIEKVFLKTLERLDLDINKTYIDNCYELKVLDFILKYDKSLDTNKEKIYINDEQISQLSKSPYITFKYQSNNTKVINPNSYDHDKKISKDILNFIDKIGDKYKTIFNIKEESKEILYNKMKNDIEEKYYSYHKSYNTITTKNRLKFMVLYSLENSYNYIKEFNGINIYNHDKKEDESIFRLYEILKNDLKLDDDKKLKLFSLADFFRDEFNYEYYITNKDLSIKSEQLPDNFKDKYINIFKKIGLNIDEKLPIIREKLINDKKINSDELLVFTQLQLKNTIEFISGNKKEYRLDNLDSIQNIFSKMEEEQKINLTYLPILQSKEKIIFTYIAKYQPKKYITSEQLKSSNKLFQKRLLQEIGEKDIIYLDILNLENIPSNWYEIKENKDEKIDNEKQQLDKQEKYIKSTLKDQDENADEYRWMIGWKGEKYIYEKLIKKFDIDKIVWHNKDAKSIQDDRGGIDIEVKDSNNKTIHNIEIKTTVKSTSKEESVSFTLSSKQFEAATDWGRDIHLIFVTGIEDDEPKVLYMNFDNNWLI